MPSLPSLKIGLALDSATFQREVRAVGSSVDRLGRNVQQQSLQMERGFAGVTRAASLLRTGLATLGVGAVTAGFTSIIRSSLDTTDALSKQARAVGLGIEALQAYQRGAELAGVGTEQLGRSLETFSQRVGEAAAGEGELLTTVSRLGIAIRDQHGDIRNTSDLLADFADSIAGAGSAQEKLAIAADAFGRGAGAGMVEFLSDGSAGLRQMEADLARVTHVTGQQAHAIETFNDSMTSLNQNITTGFSVAVGEAILTTQRWESTLTPVIDRLRDAVALLGGPLALATRLTTDAIADLSDTGATAAEAMADLELEHIPIAWNRVM